MHVTLPDFSNYIKIGYCTDINNIQGTMRPDGEETQIYKESGDHIITYGPVNLPDSAYIAFYLFNYSNANTSAQIWQIGARQS